MNVAWYTFDNENDRVLGPLSAAEIVDRVCQGQVRPTTLVRLGVDGSWVPATDVEELAPAFEAAAARANSAATSMSKSRPGPRTLAETAILIGAGGTFLLILGVILSKAAQDNPIAGALCVIGLLSVIAAFIVYKADPNVQAEAITRERTAQQQKKSQDAQIVCPHCQHRGSVVTKKVAKPKGISGAKASAAILTSGLSVPFFGLSQR